MRILITGGNGFIGKNLRVRLEEHEEFKVDLFCSSDDLNELGEKIASADWIVHLAGVNRPENPDDFSEVNTGFTKTICELIASKNSKASILFASSTQASLDNSYGKSKLAAENCLMEFSKKFENSITVFRLPNVFGKWCRPSYNSVVATFCHRIANSKDIDIHDPKAVLNLVYIDDVVDSFLKLINQANHGFSFEEITPVYKLSLSDLADKLRGFHESRDSLLIDQVGVGLERALYATYLSYLDPADFSYKLTSHQDDRGSFVEFIKTANSGQISFLTAKPGVTRGGHYHHTKSEKFLVVQGNAEFKFKNIVTNETFAISVTAGKAEVVETIPGWAHDITNTGKNDLIVLLWANEIFDHNRPDTVGANLDG